MRLWLSRCFGKITKRNLVPQVNKLMPDGSREKINFYVYYEVDDDEVKTLLRAECYDGDDEGSWVLLESDPGRGQELNSQLQYAE
mmetsp:Transcript_30488/g.68795  ORF Transcript_30488/g.68795 Transcript_30488/m.68795 type:complete len:85 (-) Transcript_30488:1292-1546(-)